MNFTDGSLSNELLYDDNLCENITNHWLYFIFTGYLLPIISPKVRNYFKELINSLKNNEISGKVVTLTEFGFQKIQDIENNQEMKNFIIRLCIERNIEFDDDTIQKISWLFSGDSNEYHESISQTWKKLNNILNNLEIEQMNKNSIKP